MEEENEKVEEPKEVKKEKKHWIHPTWLRRTLKTLLGVLIFILLVPVLVYLPPVQDLAIRIAQTELKKSTGMDVEIKHFRLHFPLDVSLQDLSIVEASGDTMISAREAVADVKLLPLFKLDVQVNELRLNDAYYRLVAPDTSMIMTIRAGLLEIDDQSSVQIKESNIDLHKAVIDNADIQMFTDVWKKKPNPDDTVPSPFKIRIGELDATKIRFGMSSLPSIDTLALYAGKLQLKNGYIDLEKSRITADELKADNGSFKFLTPTEEYIKTHPEPIDTISKPSPPMTIEANNVSLLNFNGLYGVAGALPQPGFDAAYLEVSGVNIILKNFFNRASELRLPIVSMQAHERCGLQITEGRGLVALDSAGINLDTLQIKTPYSRIDMTADIPFSLMELKPYAPVDIYANMSVGVPDIVAFMPSLRSYTKFIPGKGPLNLAIDAHGTLSDLDISTFDLALPSVLSLRASGTARNPLDFKNLVAHVNIDGELNDPAIANSFTGDLGFKIPRLKIEGEVNVERQSYDADLALVTSEGNVAAKGKVNLNSETYDAHVKVNDVNVAYFVPDIGIGKVTATLDAKGNGFNPENPKASTDVKLYIDDIGYRNLTLTDISLAATLSDHNYDISLNSPNSVANIDLSLAGSIYPDKYAANGYLHCRRLDLKALGLDTADNAGSFDIYIDGTASPKDWLYDVDLTVNNLDWTLPDRTIILPEGIKADLLATAESVVLKLDCQQTTVAFNSPEGLQELINKFSGTASTVFMQVAQSELMMDSIQQALPQFDLSVYTPGSGLVEEFLADKDINFNTFSLNLRNDSIITGNVEVLGLTTKSLDIDTITLGLHQRNYLLDYKLHVGNRPGTFDEVHEANLNGYIGGNRFSAYLNQQNLAGETGYKIGFTGALSNNMVTLHFTPLNAMIGYRPWTLNADNYIDLNLSNYTVEANLEASSNESAILLATNVGADDQQELHLKLTNIRVQDFLQMSATAPPLTATVNSDIRARYDGQELVGIGRLGISDFSYDNTKIDDINLQLQASMNKDNSYDVAVSMAVDRKKALTLSSKLVNEGEGLQPEFVKLDLNKFPLSVANAFLGNDVAQLKGTVSGGMDLSGGFTSPILNGSLTCDSVSVYLPIMGSSLRFDSEPLTVTDNVIKFNQFDIWGANNNPLTINGTVDATKLNDIYLDITANANNFQLVGNDRRAGSDLYGKLFLNLSASAKGPMTRFDANASLNILGSTDVYYTIPDANTAIQEQKNTDVVKFVNLSDTTTVKEVQAESVFMRVNANVSITPGAMVTVNLSSNGTDRVQLSPSGTLTLYRNFMGDITLNGQLNTGNGFARYNVPVIGEKEFVFDPSSYVLWNGPLMNPLLNIKATDTMKVSVSQSGGNSRLVNFLVKLNVGGTLNSPSVLFDLATDDDMTIQNQLQGMSADQRNSAAMNLLITGQYSAGDISSNSGPLVGNVYNFLTQQLNSWAAKNIRGVDLSFGVNQYDMTNNGETSTTTSYSYQLSKSLFNNRFKISIGGNYSTDDSTDDNLTQNLISDISFEYILRQTQTQSMLVKLFRHNGYESILEGEIIEMGAGFVYKRKIGDFKSFFNTGRKRKPKLNILPGATTDSIPASNAENNYNNTSEK